MQLVTAEGSEADGKEHSSWDQDLEEHSRLWGQYSNRKLPPSSRCQATAAGLSELRVKDV